MAPKTAQKLFTNFAEKLADSCFELDPAWKLKPAPSVLTHRPIVSDELVSHLRNGSIVSVPGLTRFVDGCHVELHDDTILQVDAVIFCTGYKADFIIPPQFSPAISPSKGSEPGASFGVPALPRLYQNIFSPEHPDSLAYLCNWTLGDGLNVNADLASMAITQVWKRSFHLPLQEQMNREIDAHHAWVRDIAGTDGTFSGIVQQGSWINWLNDAAGTGINEKLGYGLQGWMYWLWQPRFCNLLMTGVDSPYVVRLFEGRRKRWAGAKDAILRANKNAESDIERHRNEKKLR